MNAMNNLHKAMVESQHPGAPIINAAFEVSNSPEFLRGVARLMLEAAEADLQEEYDTRNILLGVAK